jgi:hypothetical protein
MTGRKHLPPGKPPGGPIAAGGGIPSVGGKGGMAPGGPIIPGGGKGPGGKGGRAAKKFSFRVRRPLYWILTRKCSGRTTEAHGRAWEQWWGCA